MQQRVALARALVNLPKVLLLDEPLGALDLKLRKGLQVELKRIQREVGITFVYVTHDQEEALTMSDRIAVMNKGRIEQCAGPEDVYERPTTTFVAGFIGVSNLMPGTVEVTSANARGQARRRGRDRGSDRRHDRRRALPRDRPPREASDRPSTRRRRRTRATAGRQVGGQVESLGVPRHRRPRSSSGSQGDARMTVLVPNADEAERARLPGGGADVRLSGRRSTSTSFASRRPSE